MNLVSCRYNPNHKMKPSKREIHEQKCPDRFTCKKKFKYCPYDPQHLIAENEYESHIINCKSRPNITAEEEEEIERAKALNDIATEREQIQYARQKYYKGCVEEPEIPGLGKAKQQKKKNVKKLKAKFSELNNKEADRLAAIAQHVNEEIDDDNKHELEDFVGDQNFEFEKEEDEKNNKKNLKKLEKIIEEKSIDDSKNEEIKKDINDRKDKKEESNNGYFYVYDPNDEDKEIGKDSANIIDPDKIYKILKKHE